VGRVCGASGGEEECVKGFGRNTAGRRQPAIYRGECKDGIKIYI
jgi:hypothetical protein